MFTKGILRDEGIDITLKNNPDHVLSPDDWEMVMKAKFGKISAKEYKTWYLNLLKQRWQTRKKEFTDLAREGLEKEIKLKCFCPNGSKMCHAHMASDFMNALSSQIAKNQ